MAEYFRKKFKLETARDYGLFCIELIKIALNPLGIRVCQDCKVYWLSFACAFFGVQHLLLSFYTIYYYWDKNRISSIQPLAVMAVSVPVSE